MDNYCKHGNHISNPSGPDHICSLCEDGADYLVNIPCWRIFLNDELYKTAYSVDDLQMIAPLFSLANSEHPNGLVELEIAIETNWVSLEDFDPACMSLLLEWYEGDELLNFEDIRNPDEFEQHDCEYSDTPFMVLPGYGCPNERFGCIEIRRK